MAKSPLTAEKKLKQAKQLRLLLIVCGLFTLMNVVLRIATGPFNPTYVGVEALLGLGCILYGVNLNKTVKKLRMSRKSQEK